MTEKPRVVNLFSRVWSIYSAGLQALAISSFTAAIEKPCRKSPCCIESSQVEQPEQSSGTITGRLAALRSKG
jgi:hypothetical protein